MVRPFVTRQQLPDLAARAGFSLAPDGVAKRAGPACPLLPVGSDIWAQGTERWAQALFLLSRDLNSALQASSRSPGVPVRGLFATQEAVSGQQGAFGV